MRIINIRLLRDFWESHPDAQGPLKAWFRTARMAEWKSLEEARGTYSGADGVPTRGGEVLTVFNIGGHKYRLVARIRYDWKLINDVHPSMGSKILLGERFLTIPHLRKLAGRFKVSPALFLAQGNR